MNWFEWLGVFGSVASIIGLVPISFTCCHYIKGKIIYNKLMSINFTELTDAYYKADVKKRKLFRKQNAILKQDIGKVKEGHLNKANINEAIMNMIENQENIKE